MSLKYLVDILPSSESLDKSLSPYESSTLTLATFSSSVGYIQRALLGYDSSNSYACLAVASLGRPLTEPKCHINYLPVELLREIFILCLPDETWTHLLNASDPPAPYPPCQLTLSQVCSYWRRVALSFPDLWSTIIVISPGPCHVPLVELWLERSGQLPLTFYIDNRNCDTWEKECASITAAEDVIYLLRPHVRRWKSATFKLFARLQPLSWSAAHPSGCLSLLESLMGLPSDCFSLLETLHFDVDEYLCRYHSESIKQIGEMFLSSSLTQLKEVEWKTRKFLHHDTLVFPANLTHLSGDFVLDTSFLSALSELKNLHFLRLNGSCNWDRFRYEQPLTLDKLHTLDLRTASSTQSLLNLIVAPNLTVLAIGTPFPEDNYAALPLFLTRCRCNLKTFSYFSSTAYHTHISQLYGLRAPLLEGSIFVALCRFTLGTRCRMRKRRSAANGVILDES
ncbi:hypothetical protein BDP27DRAFT_413084 [Rhodocollybia butyracea]|uniref:F-box domain-containing protein n=1 Tax=Rhodocollybia butyracea TaxID=206335 RepID=A0A9P5Q053_9AGAR|nr:hypothetical protein BDP27DRAFT_413084 [Rhodocollybia butyracea]